jgi:hypothetical protein
MKIKALVIVLISLLSFSRLNAQGKFYLGLEFSHISDQYSFSEPYSLIGAPWSYGLQTPGTTLLLGYDLNKIISIETGFSTKPFKSGYSIRSVKSTSYYQTASSTYSGDVRYQVPLRLRSNINIFRELFFLQTVVGLHYGYNNGPLEWQEQLYGLGGTQTANFIQSELAYHQELNNHYLLFETGLSLKYVLSSRFSFFASASSFKGNRELSKIRVLYGDSDGVTQENTIINKGDYNSIMVGIKMNLGRSEKV